MGDIIRINNSDEKCKNIIEQFDLLEVSSDMLVDVRTSLGSKNTLGMPIFQVANLGAGVASLLPVFRTVTQTTTSNANDLFQLANASVGDTLKIAKNGNFWGAFKTADGGSKFAQLQPVGSFVSKTEEIAAINPAFIMMAVALFSIEQKLEKIEEMQKQIISFLEMEKKSEIEADVETLMSIINNYKNNWDNDHFVASNHKLVLDIQRTARKNMLTYQKKVNEVLTSNKLLISKAVVESTLKDMQKKFQYYRLSLFSFSMASLIEIMLSGNFKEESIIYIRDEIEKRSLEYREEFSKCSEYLEKMTNLSIETNVLKGVSVASNAMGNFIGKIPVVKDGQVDEFLQNNGDKLTNKSKGIERSFIDSFRAFSNPETSVFVEKMNDMIRIYNHTKEICFDENNIYLIPG